MNSAIRVALWKPLMRKQSANYLETTSFAICTARFPPLIRRFLSYRFFANHL